MREIKFRAWDKKEKKMIYPGNVYMPDLTATGCPVDFKTRKNLSLRYELNQFTGSKDRNRTEIYKEDIVKLHVDTGSHVDEGEFEIGFECDYIGKVIFVSTGTYITKIRVENENTPHGIYDNTGTLCSTIPKKKRVIGYRSEVIGNIYENGDLLK